MAVVSAPFRQSNDCLVVTDGGGVFVFASAGFYGSMGAASPALERPTITLACGDGQALLTHPTWSSRTPNTVATGGHAHDTTAHDCAQDALVSTPASASLRRPIETDLGQEVAMICAAYADPADFGGSFTETEVAPTSTG